jgi:hypothetical protein
VAADTYRDWSMYASDKYQFTLRYPSYLAVNPAAAQMLSHSQTETAVQFVKNTAGASRGTSITVTATAVADDHTLDQEIAEQKQKLGRVLLQQEMTIGGLRAIRLWVSAPLEGGTIQEDYVFVRKGSNVLTFSSSGDENRDLFEKMIKTVTFSFNR